MQENKAGYTAIPVADGWAGAEMRVFTLFDSCSWKDGPMDGPTDGPMDRPTDGRTKAFTGLRLRN